MTVDRPTEDISWAEDPQAKIGEPVNERARGFPEFYVPPAEQKNWLQRSVGRWIDHLSQTGGSFGSMTDAANTLDAGGSATVRTAENAPYFQPVVQGLSAGADTLFSSAVGTDGRRLFCEVADNIAGSSKLVAIEQSGGSISQVAQSAAVSDRVRSIDSDGKTAAVVWQEFAAGSPTGDFRVEFYEASGDLSAVAGSVTYGSPDDVRDLICIGSHVVAAVKNGTSDTIRLDAYETANFTLDWTLNLPATGIIASGAFTPGPGGLASNGEFISLYVSDGTDRYVFFFNADGTTPDGSPSTDWPDVRGYAEILPTDTGISNNIQSLWIGSTYYAGTDSAVGAGAVSAVRLRGLSDPSVYLGEVDAEIVWRGSSLPTGDFFVSMTTDGERLYGVITDTAGTSDVVFVALDTTRREERDPAGVTGPVQWLAEDYILDVDNAAQDVPDVIVCDGLHLWCVRGTGLENTVDLLSTTRLSRRFHRADGAKRFRQPFHNLLIPEQ